MRKVFLAAVAAVVAAVVVNRRRSQKRLSEGQFVDVMTQLATAVFEKLFEFAQVAHRLAVREQDDIVFDSLLKVQDIILRKCNVTQHQLQVAQKAFPNPSLVNSVPRMYEMYTSGLFPVLSPGGTVPPDEELLTVLDLAMGAKVEAHHRSPAELNQVELDIILKAFASRAEFNNALSLRMNASAEFKSRLVQIVLHNQTKLRQTLS